MSDIGYFEYCDFYDSFDFPFSPNAMKILMGKQPDEKAPNFFDAFEFACFLKKSHWKIVLGEDGYAHAFSGQLEEKRTEDGHWTCVWVPIAEMSPAEAENALRRCESCGGDIFLCFAIYPPYSWSSDDRIERCYPTEPFELNVKDAHRALIERGECDPDKLRAFVSAIQKECDAKALNVIAEARAKGEDVRALQDCFANRPNLQQHVYRVCQGLMDLSGPLYALVDHVDL